MVRKILGGGEFLSDMEDDTMSCLITGVLIGLNNRYLIRILQQQPATVDAFNKIVRKLKTMIEELLTQTETASTAEGPEGTGVTGSRFPGKPAAASRAASRSRSPTMVLFADGSGSAFNTGNTTDSWEVVPDTMVSPLASSVEAPPAAAQVVIAPSSSSSQSEVVAKAIIGLGTSEPRKRKTGTGSDSSVTLGSHFGRRLRVGRFSWSFVRTLGSHG